MVYFLILTILILTAVVVYQMIQLRNSRLQHEQKMEILREVILELAANSSAKKRQLELSDELMAKLRSANAALSQEIAAMVSEFVETLSMNNLLR